MATTSAQPCHWCHEPLTGVLMRLGVGAVYHWACGLRLLFGTAAHHQRRCDCYVPGSTEDDPPGVTKRVAAIAATQALFAQRGTG